MYVCRFHVSINNTRLAVVGMRQDFCKLYSILVALKFPQHILPFLDNTLSKNDSRNSAGGQKFTP